MSVIEAEKNLLDLRPWGAWILLEGHSIKHCTCSYCRNSYLGNIGSDNSKILKYLRFRVSLPESKTRNAWRRITFKGFKYYWYLRWTLPQTDKTAEEILEKIGE